MTAASAPEAARGGPLAGIRVLDLSRILAGPYCTYLLAQYGADVIKIENPDGGDDTRAFGPPFREGESAYFLSVNAGKRSVALNLKEKADREFARSLAARCDIVIENFRPGTAAKLGLGYEDLKALKPDLVYCSVSGFGQTGPWADRPGYDLAVQGLAGLMSITGPEGGAPHKVGVSIADILSGIYAFAGILLALHHRSRTGEGQYVDVSMMDSIVSILTFQAGIHFMTGETPTRKGNAHPTIAPYETFRASDGWLNLAVGNDKLWAAFCALVERPDLAAHPDFATNPKRVANRPALLAALEPILAAKPKAHWLEALEKAGIPAGPILDLAEVLAHPQTIARGMVVEVPHARLGLMKVTGPPVKLSKTPGAVRSGPPTLGEQTDEVRREFGKGG